MCEPVLCAGGSTVLAHTQSYAPVHSLTSDSNRIGQLALAYVQLVSFIHSIMHRIQRKEKIKRKTYAAQQSLAVARHFLRNAKCSCMHTRFKIWKWTLSICIFLFLFYCTCIYMIHMGMSMSIWSSSTRRHNAVCTFRTPTHAATILVFAWRH